MTKASENYGTEQKIQQYHQSPQGRKKNGYLKNTERVFESIMTEDFPNWTKAQTRTLKKLSKLKTG